MVAEFHQTFEHPIAEAPDTKESLKIRQLRIKLLFEELVELAEASDCKRTLVDLCATTSFDIVEKSSNGGNLGGYELNRTEFLENVTEAHDSHNVIDGDNVNKIEELDALCDIQYVLNGKILTAGLQNTFDPNFVLVHSNNMAKAHQSIEHAKETIDKLDTDPIGFQLLASESGKYRLLNKDGKLVKPHDHVKVALDLNLR